MKSKNPKSLYKEISPLGKNQNKQVIARWLKLIKLGVAGLSSGLLHT